MMTCIIITGDRYLRLRSNLLSAPAISRKEISIEIFIPFPVTSQSIHIPTASMKYINKTGRVVKLNSQKDVLFGGPFSVLRTICRFSKWQYTILKYLPTYFFLFSFFKSLRATTSVQLRFCGGRIRRVFELNNIEP